jgi:putative holliday junction resolvase
MNYAELCMLVRPYPFEYRFSKEFVVIDAHSRLSKILAIDVGARRVGVASAPQGVVIPEKVLSRANGEAERVLRSLIKERGIEIVVAGLPLSDDNTENEQTGRVKTFCRRLERRTGVEIVFEDEYLTSVEAEELLHQTSVRGRRAIQALDAVAASIILQRYLDRMALVPRSGDEV